MAPAVCFLDEVEKASAGVSAAARRTAASRASVWQLLAWLNDHESDVFVGPQANDNHQAAPNSRGERSTACFFWICGYRPAAGHWKIYIDQLSTRSEPKAACRRGVTGAEVKPAALAAAPDLRSRRGPKHCARFHDVCGVGGKTPSVGFWSLPER